MSHNGGELVRIDDIADISVTEHVISTQGISGIASEESSARVDASEAPLDDFVPGAYEIMPLIRKLPNDDGGSYESGHFHRSRHHGGLPDRVMSGMNAVPAPSLDQLGLGLI